MLQQVCNHLLLLLLPIQRVLLCRNIGLVGDMLVSLQRLLPAGAAAGAGSTAAAGAGRLSPQEAKQLAAGLSGMCDVLLNNITRCACLGCSSSRQCF
jgi:hypothetical protein